MDKQIRSGLKALFLVHALVGLIFGLAYLAIPATFAGWFNMPHTDEPYMRMIGAAILGFSATSLVGFQAHSWAEVKIVVQGEFVWTGLAALLALWSVLDGTWPVAGWINFGLMALFFIAFGYFYWREEGTLTVPKPAPRT
jgi:hypothetical protein